MKSPVIVNQVHRKTSLSMYTFWFEASALLNEHLKIQISTASTILV